MKMFCIIMLLMLQRQKNNVAVTVIVLRPWTHFHFVIHSFLVQMCGCGCVPCVVLGVSLFSHSVPSQAESPSPVDRYQSVPVTEAASEH